MQCRSAFYGSTVPSPRKYGKIWQITSCLSSLRHSGGCREGCSRAAAPSDVFVLDFDGVLVDSEPEVSEAGIRAACACWPHAFTDPTDDVVARLRTAMRDLRPALVNGYESMLLARLLYEGKTHDEIIHNWDATLADACARFHVTEGDLEIFLEDWRQRWMSEEPDAYLAANSVYKGVREALMYCEHPFYIASSKKAKRVSALASRLLQLHGFEEGSPRLFAGLIPPNQEKARTLRTIMERPLCMHSSTRLHFVDDRVETLQAIAEAPDLHRWNLHFADWGYSTAKDKRAADDNVRIDTMTLSNFVELLKWGMLMGVDDGCEPEPHEVQEMIAHDHGLKQQ